MAINGYGNNNTVQTSNQALQQAQEANNRSPYLTNNEIQDRNNWAQFQHNQVVGKVMQQSVSQIPEVQQYRAQQAFVQYGHDQMNNYLKNRKN
jgi:hypothetical protein